MDCSKIGALLLGLRNEKGMTQKQVADEMHDAVIEDAEGEYYITFTHEMSKAHYISFVAYVTTDRVLLIKLYPEQTPSVRLPKLNSGKLKQRNSGCLYYYCKRHGLWVI